MRDKVILNILIFLVLILIAVVCVGGYFIYQNNQINQNIQIETTPQAMPIKHQELYNASINDLVLNITSAKGRLKLMKFSFTLKSSDSMIEEMVQNNKDEIIDLVISLINQRNSEELLTIGGQLLLKEDLLVQINRTVNSWKNEYTHMKENSIKKILFTTFVMK
ncbi:MAG: flagellar basal body-associated FliL family protein [Candidatus Marinarcus sp.]|uniref:flagellar basal body-associated FliL family protein n=1 Tax=Candidatus Marinarcus sp. TaxID=3100987 RepID=UPI003AFF7E56